MAARTRPEPESFGTDVKAPVVQRFQISRQHTRCRGLGAAKFSGGIRTIRAWGFCYFLDDSRASLLEVKNELGVGLDRGYWDEGDFSDADALANRALKALSGLQAYLRSPRAKRNAERARAAHSARHSARTNPTNPRT